MSSQIIYVVLNSELNMSAGKAAAQSVHAAALVLNRVNYSRFTDNYKRSVIILEAKNQQQILNLNEYLTGANIISEYYIDEGVNEVAPYSITDLAVEPIGEDDMDTREILSAFRLFNPDKKMKFFTKGIR